MACELSRKTLHYVTLFIDGVQVRYVNVRLDKANKRYDIVDNCCVVSVQLVTVPIKLLTLEADSTFIIARQLPLRVNDCCGVTCLED